MAKRVLSQEPEVPEITIAPELSGRERVFEDRTDAGAALSRLIENESGQDLRTTGAWILAIPAGGVPVAAEMARRLELPLDFVVVSKVWLPWNHEAGYGAAAFDGSVRLNVRLIRELALANQEVRYGVEKTKARVERRARMLRGNRGYEHLRGRTVVVVDDGLASGFTMLTAIAALRRLGVARVEVAVPTSSRDAAEAVARDAERLFCANLREGFPFAVADAYRHWRDVDDSELASLLPRSSVTEGDMNIEGGTHGTVGLEEKPVEIRRDRQECQDAR